MAPVAWPSATDYRDAIQNPARAFRIPRLQAARAEENRMGVPRARAGSFANVYKMTNGSDACAVRVFLYPQPERQQRYQEIRDHLRRATGLSGLVDFDYDPEGITVNGHRYPLMTMDWVKGASLGEWVRGCAERKEAPRLRAMADRWADLARQLRRAQIAHGDLQHDNVMVVQDCPVLVDYDGMCVPTLVGRPSLEFGKPAYQHPARLRLDQLTLELDHYAAWIILVALRAMAADLGLYERYIARQNNENLLFLDRDLQQPDQSALWRDLGQSPDAEVRQWAQQLRAALAGPFDAIPAFDPDPCGALTAAVKAQPRDWERIDQTARQLTQAGTPIPAPLQGACAEAGLRVACRGQLQAAVQAQSVRQIVRQYDPNLLDDWPAAAALVARAREAVKQCKALDELDAAARQVGDGRAFVALWRSHEKLLAGVSEAAPHRQAAETWQKKIAACDKFLALLRPGAAAKERDVADAWREVERAGIHPDAAPHQARGREAARRVELLEKLGQVPTAKTWENDERFARAWDEALLKNCREADDLRGRLKEVRERLARLEELDRLSAEIDRGAAEEGQLPAKAAALPADYRKGLAERVQTARDRDAREREFLALVTNPAARERAIADAWARVKAAGGHYRKAKAHAARGAEAQARADLLERLQAVPDGGEDHDRRFEGLWDEGLLRGCQEADRLAVRRKNVRDRLALLDQLDALAAQVDAGRQSERDLARLADALPASYAHRLSRRVETARLRVAQAADLERALQGSSDLAVADAWDKAQTAGLPPLDPATVARCQLARRRRDGLRRLDAIERSATAEDERDAAWLKAWDENLLGPCADAGRHRNRHRLAQDRAARWQALDEVLRQKDLSRIRPLAQDPLLANYPPAQRRRAEIDRLAQQAEKWEQVMGLLRNGRPAEFGARADLEYLRQNLDLFAPYREQIETSLRNWLAREAALNRTDPAYSVRPLDGVVVARWTCPHYHQFSYCRVAWDARRTFRTPAEARDETCNITAEEYKRNGGAALPIQPGVRSWQVSIWPVIRLWTELHGQPLHLSIPLPRA